MTIVATATLALVTLVVASSLLAERVAGTIQRIEQHFLPRAVLRPQLLAQFDHIRRGLQDAVAANDLEMLEATRPLRDTFIEQLVSARSAVDPADAKALHAAIDDYFISAFNVSRRLISNEAGEAIGRDIAAMGQKHAHTAELIGDATRLDPNAMRNAIAEAEQTQHAASVLRLAISAACILVVVFLAWGIGRSVLRSLANLSEGIRRFGEGNFATPIPLLSEDEIAAVARQANRMAQRLDHLAIERSHADWQRAGLAGLAKELRGEMTPHEAATRAMTFLAQYLGAAAGALYYQTQEEGETLHLLGGYALPRPPVMEFARGEGIVGQAALQSGLLTVDTSEEWLQFRSGTVEGTPRSVVCLPLVHLKRVTGVLELASPGQATQAQKEFLLSVRETVTVTIEVARGRAAQQALLEETQRQAAELREKNTALLDARQHLEQKAIELTTASAFKSQFLANMSHELRTPLNAIMGFAELLKAGEVPCAAPEHDEFLGDILASSHHLMQLINDVLDLSKVEAGRVEFRPEKIRTAAVVDEVMTVLRGPATLKSMHLEVHIDPAVEELVLDPARLKQVLYNYLVNALKFTPAGGSVTLRALPEPGDQVRFEVEDTGIGIAQEDLGRLFVEFQQLDTPGIARQGGTGLGLALTKRLVEAQAGRVGVQSEQGKGSTFFAVLPRRMRGDPQVVEPLTVYQPEPPTVLVVERDAADQSKLVAALTRAGYKVEPAATGEEATERCRTRTYDAITLDLLLADVDGLEVLRRIRAEGLNRDVPVIVVTVVSEQGSVAGFAVQDVLNKPIDETALLAALGRAGVTAGHSDTVLVIDDDQAALRLMTATLEKLGHRARGEHDSQAALQLALSDPPAAIVLDLVMPGVDGFEFLDRLRSKPAGRHIPVVVWTVKDLSAHEHARLRASAQAIVAKGRGGPAGVADEIETFLRKRSKEA